MWNVVRTLLKEGQIGFVSPETSIAEAERFMRRCRVGAVLVLSSSRKPLGLVTESSIHQTAHLASGDRETTSVDHIMTETSEAVQQDAGFYYIIESIRRGEVQQAAVVEREGLVKGVLCFGRPKEWLHALYAMLKGAA